MSDKLTPVEEQAFDALLAEVYGDAPAPDLPAKILSQLQQRDVRPVVSKRRTASPSVGLIVAVVGLAASILLVVWLRGEGQVDEKIAQQPDVEQNEPVPNAPSGTELADGGSAESVESAKPNKPFKMPEGISIAKGPQSTSQEDGTSGQADALPVTPSAPLDVQLVSRQHDQDFSAYWAAIGIQPGEFEDYEQVAQRLQSRLGILISRDGLQDANELRRQIAGSNDASKLARAWLNLLSANGFNALKGDRGDALLEEMTAAIRGDSAFDTAIARWTGGYSDASEAWYASLAAAGKEGIVQRLGAITMNVDMRCIQCHDSMIQRGGHQDDYWSLAALIGKSVRREGAEFIFGVAKKPRAIFYELADGRQKAAHPMVPARWTDQGKPIETLKEWASSLIGSERLARGTVNSLWNLVHGRPLRASVIDSISAPHHETLDALEDRLVEQLIESKFDIAGTLALIITSPASQLAVPDALMPGNALFASDADMRKARDLIGSFAANFPASTPASRNKSARLALVMRSVGGMKTLPDNNVVNAQADSTSSSSSGTKKRKPMDASYGYPTTARELPVHWLASVKGFDNQVSHLAYLAGKNRVPDNIQVISDALREADDVSPELALQRIWWVLSP